MKNFFEYFRIIAFAAVIGFAMTACGDLGEEELELTVGSTNGELTITGLEDEHNGKWVVVLGEDADGNILIAAEAVSTDGTITGVQVTSSLEVTLKVWKIEDKTKLVSFTGNGELDFDVFILNKATTELEPHGDHYHIDENMDEEGHIEKAQFTNGKGEGEFEEGEGHEHHEH
jgi:hypothetical protein